MKEPRNIIPGPMPTDKRFKNFSGQTIGQLTVLEYLGKWFEPCGKATYYWKCLCTCGNIVTVVSGSLGRVFGGSRSCGCTKTKHMLSYTTGYRAWKALTSRCYGGSECNAKSYVSRGIKVCHRWLSSVIDFCSDVGHRPSPKHSIDRIDNNGHYSCGKCDECLRNGWPMNVRWATDKEQMRNTRRTRMVEWNGKSISLSELAEEAGIGYTTIRYRLDAGWPINRVVSKDLYSRWGGVRKFKLRTLGETQSLTRCAQQHP